MEMSYKSSSGTVGWSCPSNIALIKYWGKRPVQLPGNPSLSMTLEVARTMTRLKYEFDPLFQNPSIHFQFEGMVDPFFENRVKNYIKEIRKYMPVLTHTSLQIESANTFPHSSGIASSASSMGALSMCLVSLENKIKGLTNPLNMRERASFLARIGSGSASRSVYPNFALWGATDEWTGSNDEYAIPVTGYHEEFGALCDTILVVDSGKKKISSSKGHSLMDENPYSATRFTQARQNLKSLKTVLAAGDWDGFISVLELEALSLHAMMMTSRSGYMLMQPATISIIEKVLEFRKETGCRMGFSLDAGPNVHLIYSHSDSDQIIDFITSELRTFCEDDLLIMDRIGEGPTEL